MKKPIKDKLKNRLQNKNKFMPVQPVDPKPGGGGKAIRKSTKIKK